jgi:alpha-tubulin suppressor-like RCC1 family protein
MGGLETFTTVAAWGDNFFGQLGNGVPLPYPDDSRSTMPLEVSNLDGAELKAIAGGANHSLALKNDGTVLAWGLNQDGELGDGTNTDSSTPVEVKDPNDPSGYLSGVKALTAGSSHSLALKDDGTIWAWGNNWFGQLGDGTTTDGTQTTCEVTMIGGRTSSSCPDSNTPVQMSEVGGIEAIAAGGAHGLALKDDGTVWAWGMNQDGQLGNGTYTLGTSTPGINTPVQVSNLSAVKAIAGGGQHSLAGW